jgi:hypothetical protein
VKYGLRPERIDLREGGIPAAKLLAKSPQSANRVFAAATRRRL